MTEDGSEDTEYTAGPSQQDTEKIEWTTKFDPALRTDKRIAGSVVVFFLLFLAAFGYSSGDYPIFAVGGLLALAFLIVLLMVPYNRFREAW